MTFQELCQLWQSRDHQHRPATTRQLNNCLRIHLLPRIGDKPLETLDHATLWACLATLEAQGKYATLKQSLTWLRRIIRWAVAMGLMPTDTTTALSATLTGPKHHQHYRHVPLGDLPPLLNAIEALPLTPQRLALQCMLHTGQRPGTIVSSEWTSIDLASMTWHFPGHLTKNHRDHAIPITPTLQTLLQQLPQNGRYLFPSSRGPSPTPLSVNTVRSLLKPLGVQGRQHLHGFRHLMSTILNSAGWPVDWIEYQLHHLPQGIRATYNQARYEGPRRVMMGWFSDYLYALQQHGTLSEAQHRDFARRVQLAITADASQYALWNVSTSAPASPQNETQPHPTPPDSPSSRRTERKTLAPWRQ